MKVQLLKNLIKEAVREVLQEELKEILTENKLISPQAHSSNNPTLKQQLVDTEYAGKDNTSPSNFFSSIESILNETRLSMSKSDYSNVIGEGTQVNLSSPLSSIDDVPKVGVDIENLDFVKKAAAVYNLSNEKSRR